MIYRAIIIICLAALGLRPVGAGSPARFRYTQVRMGVSVRITVYAPSEAAARRSCEAAFRRFSELDAIMSDYRSDSELMRLCDRAGGPPVKVSPALWDILNRSAAFSRLSGGAFDVTVGPYVRLWREARKTGAMPSEEALWQACALVGWEKIELDARKRSVRLLVPGMRLDLGGIAKGYACDAALKVLRRHGITSALVEAGGDVAAAAPPPGAKGWRIEIAHAGGGPRLTLLSCAAISTSGDTEQHVELGGNRYSHIVDPRTGIGLTARVAATVIARNAATSDALATALCVLGREKGQALAHAMPGVRVFIRQVEE
ncbi:MAG: FAD:protein FMN transferase [Armatimonadetes bacterium]|nr:FAD:protein FMN transferase [Armatimonadota bacterium]